MAIDCVMAVILFRRSHIPSTLRNIVQKVLIDMCDTYDGVIASKCNQLGFIFTIKEPQSGKPPPSLSPSLTGVSKLWYMSPVIFKSSASAGGNSMNEEANDRIVLH